MDMCERWLSRFDLAAGSLSGFTEDGCGLEGVPIGVDGVDGRDVGGVGTTDVSAGGCCAGAFGVVVLTLNPALFRFEDLFDLLSWTASSTGPVVAASVAKVVVDMSRSRFAGALDS